MNNQETSPDIFADEENSVDKENIINFPSQLLKESNEKYIHNNDVLLLRKVREGISGILPPPLNISVNEILEKISTGERFFVKQSDVPHTTESISDISNCEKSLANGNIVQGKCLLINPNTSIDMCLSLQWPKILEERYHGLCYNKGKVSEDFESLCAKFGQKYVYAETQSTCTVFNADKSNLSRRRANQLRWNVKSPGCRLSHLAKRRIIFSNGTLQPPPSNIGQILLNPKISQQKRRTPKKPNEKSPKQNCNSENAQSSLEVYPGSTSAKIHATKRALFQSPEIDRPSTSSSIHKTSAITLPSFKGNNSSKTSPYKRNLFNGKRKILESIDEMHPIKMPLRMSAVPKDSAAHCTDKKHSDLASSSLQNGELSAHHKSKLRWAVFEALKSQKIGYSHPNFKTYAATLARVTKKFLPNLASNVPRPEEGTSARMLRIALQHIHSVTKGKSVEEIIIQEARKQISNKIVKPSGYISKEDEIMNKENCPPRNVLQNKLNIMNNENTNKLSSTKDSISKANAPRFNSRVDRVRKAINFDEEEENMFR